MTNNVKMDKWIKLETEAHMPGVGLPIWALCECEYMDPTDPHHEMFEPFIVKISWDGSVWRLWEPTPEQDPILIQSYTVIYWRYV